MRRSCRLFEVLRSPSKYQLRHSQYKALSILSPLAVPYNDSFLLAHYINTKVKY